MCPQWGLGNTFWFDKAAMTYCVGWWKLVDLLLTQGAGVA